LSLGRVVDDEVVLAGGWAVMCTMESEDVFEDAELVVLLSTESVTVEVVELSSTVDELVGMGVVDTGGVEVVVTPQGGYGHQLIDVVDDTDGISCLAMWLIFQGDPGARIVALPTA
jgi:hypothetical protein